jgi:alpha-tubulin suppressor-like RCC1 family protein
MARTKKVSLLAFVVLMALAALSPLASARIAGQEGASPLIAAPKVSKQPVSVAVEAGQPASFTAAASGTPTTQWEVSLNGGASWQTIEGATSGTYTIAVTALSESGDQYRAVFTNAGGQVTSKAATLTVEVAPQVTQQPVSQAVPESDEAHFEARASGSPAPTVQWQSLAVGSSTWKTLSGATSDTLNVASVNGSESGVKFRAIFKNALGEAITEAATLTIENPPAIGQQPLSTTATEGEPASFRASATGNPAPTVQWELSTTSGASWTPISGATSDELLIPVTAPGENGYEYRAVFSNPAGTVTTSVAKLTVQGPPVVSLQPSSVTVGVGSTAAYEAAASGLPAPTVQWQVSLNSGASWSPISGATSDRLTISNAQLSESGRSYRAVFTNAAGTATTSSARLTVSATDYSAFGWGMNTRGQVGIGSSETAILTPMPIASLQFVTAVSGGQRHSLALLAGGTVEAWGFNGHGQLGDESAVGTRTPVEVDDLPGPATAIAAGGNQSLALLANGTVEAWGDDEMGQLGDGRSVDSEVPVPVTGLSGVTAIAAGEEHSMALLSNGTVETWGSNESGQLGDGKGNLSNTPQLVKGLSGVTAIAAGGDFSLALLENGTVMGWGSDAHDQLANKQVVESSGGGEEGEEGIESPVPVPVEGLSGVTAIAAGSTHALALTTGGTVMAWGNDEEGELGDETTSPGVEVPAPVAGLSNVKAISAGDQDSVALLKTGSLMTWGTNSMGSLGDGTENGPSLVPVAVVGLSKVSAVSAGAVHMLALGESVPLVSAISPQGGPLEGGTTVTITGQDLSGATAVHFGAVQASSFIVNSSTSVTAVSPAGTGTVDVTVTAPTGTSPQIAADRFTYRKAATVTKLSAKGGPATGGTAVTITGTEFTGATGVEFGGVAASDVKVVSATSITATSPANVSGIVDVTVQGAGGASAASSKDHFKYTPVVTELSPAHGQIAGGAQVVINGDGFALGTATKFKFGKAAVKVVNCTSTTKCTVTAPLSKVSGAVIVSATANKGKSVAGPGDEFTYE